MTVLVTGGAGYIGSHTVRQLQRRGDRVIVLDDLSNGHAAAVGDAHLVVGDIGDAELVARTLSEERVTDVIHLAADKSVEASLRNPVAYFQNNVTKSLALLSACVDAGKTCAAPAVDRRISGTCAATAPSATASTCTVADSPARALRGNAT